MILSSPLTIALFDPPAGWHGLSNQECRRRGLRHLSKTCVLESDKYPNFGVFIKETKTFLAIIIYHDSVQVMVAMIDLDKKPKPMNPVYFKNLSQENKEIANQIFTKDFFAHLGFLTE